jgi:hypothetical protein
MTLFTTQQVADALKINYQAAQKRLRRAGIQPTKIIGRSSLYEPSVIKKLRVERSKSNHDLTHRDDNPRKPHHRNKIFRAKSGTLHIGIDQNNEPNQARTSADDK